MIRVRHNQNNDKTAYLNLHGRRVFFHYETDTSPIREEPFFINFTLLETTSLISNLLLISDPL